MIRVDLVAKKESQATGLGRYVESLDQGLQSLGVTVRRVEPRPVRVPGGMSKFSNRLGFDLLAFFRTYPLGLRAGDAQIYHLSSQNLGLAILWSRPHETLVTVHDILPYLLRRDPVLRIYRTGIEALIDRLALAGLKKADGWIAISEYTRQTLITALGLPPDRIHLVHRAVDRKVFRPQPPPPDFLSNYGLIDDIPSILFVGSEDPRKNLTNLVQAAAILKQRGTRFQLLKVGAPHFEYERRKLHEQVGRLNLTNHIHFLDHVPNDHLPLFYNAADVVVMPSLYEGFGLPALEALSCGATVAVARSSSLPEVVGEAAAFFDPRDPDDIAECLGRLLQDPDLRQNYRASSLLRADSFSLEKQAQQTLTVYQKLLKTRAL